MFKHKVTILLLHNVHISEHIAQKVVKSCKKSDKFATHFRHGKNMKFYVEKHEKRGPAKSHFSGPDFYKKSGHF